MKNLCKIFIFFLGILITLTQSQNVHYAVKYVDQKYQVYSVDELADKNQLQDIVADIKYSPPQNQKSYFGIMHITTNGTYNDDTQAYSAGFAEGYTVPDMIYNQFQNMQCQILDCQNGFTHVVAFVNENFDWAQSQINAHPTDLYWQYVDTLQQQVIGVQDGYSNSTFGKAHPLSTWAFRFINLVGDLLDIKNAVRPGSRPAFDKMTRQELIEYINKNGRCSAIIKAADDYSEVFMGHSTWLLYSAMIRIYKDYQFNYRNPLVKCKQMVFSSYPGQVTSLDDFYELDTQLTVISTTNNVVNSSLYDLVTPQSLLTWQRSRIANAMASNGSEWYKYFAMYNSGTYNNQYMIFNNKLFKPNQAFVNNTLWVVEQMPGEVYGADVTHHLTYGYWPSYNVPFFKRIYDKMGYNYQDQSSGTLNGTFYQTYARAEIFRRDQVTVNDLNTLKILLRDNNFQSDPLSGGDAYNQICARGDLNTDPTLIGSSGCIDTKATTLTMSNQLQAEIINGPTAQNQNPFDWNSTSITAPHDGQATVFNFQFENIDFSKQFAKSVKINY